MNPLAPSPRPISGAVGFCQVSKIFIPSEANTLPYYPASQTSSGSPTAGFSRRRYVGRAFMPGRSGQSSHPALLTASACNAVLVGWTVGHPFIGGSRPALRKLPLKQSVRSAHPSYPLRQPADASAGSGARPPAPLLAGSRLQTDRGFCAASWVFQDLYSARSAAAVPPTGPQG